MEEKPEVLVVGTFRSGTNLTKHLLEKHFKAKVVFSKWFWKHGVPPTSIKTPIPPNVKVIVCSKHPVSLNKSLYSFWKKTRPSRLNSMSLSDFVRNEFVVFDNSRKGNPEYYFSSPTDYWNR